jgi:8-oxo-dGTP pyrophosphatase MutT (NUDIX family)
VARGGRPVTPNTLLGLGPSDMARRFARLRPGSAPFAPGFYGVPSDGMCLNVFLVVRSPEGPGRALLGRVAPDPRWVEAGSLDEERISRIGDRWILPSSQLILFESPDDAARRLASEQLGIELDPVPAPQVFSDTYPRRGMPDADPHWDLHFIYSWVGPASPPRSSLWKSLEYVPVAKLPLTAFARDHGDILGLVGLPPSSD